MIGYLKGTVLEKRGQWVVLDVRDVGYKVRVGQIPVTRYQIPDEVELYIHTVVRQDAIELYGFETMAELDLFELLITVSGVGPKIALGIVGSQKVAAVERAVREADVAFFGRVPGVGKKGAQRIIVDLKSKIGSLRELDLGDDGEGEDDVTAALLQFGFRREDIRKVLNSMDSEMSEAQKIKEGLRKLGRK
jgi:Holliday junction DNA helicase RuvA